MANGVNEQETRFHGVPVSGGICHGPVVVVGPRTFQIPRFEISEANIEGEIQRFKSALIKTQEELQRIQNQLLGQVEASEAGIFDAHLLVLEDQMIIDEVTRLISEDRINVESAFDQTTRKFASALSAVEDGYLRERAADMRDVSDRVMGNLLGRASSDPLRDIHEPSVIVGHDLTPSTTAQFDRDKVLGFATDVGSPTSHTAILARSLNLPAVVALRDVSSQLSSGDEVLLDGYDGVVIRDPSSQTRFTYGELVRQHETFDCQLESIRDLPAKSLDGVEITLMSNIDHPDEIEDIGRYGAGGVGLFRTEYLFLNRKSLPGEDSQFEAYRGAVENLGGRPLLVRTLDLGADKMTTALPNTHEANPAMGVRAIRYCLNHPDIFKQQLRAVLRASAFGPVKMMYPMISNREELTAANDLLEECRDELRRASVPFDDTMPIGVMIETPAAAMIADQLAEVVQFFSIGTNDLIQYGSAVDRLNERITHLYQPTHPGILRLIKVVVDSGDANNVAVSVCGEMAGDPILVPLLVGLGIRHLSLPAPVTPQVKYVIRRLEVSRAEQLAAAALAATSSSDVMALCRELVKQVAPDLES